jgi:ELWxxDGT repeat protein
MKTHRTHRPLSESSDARLRPARSRRRLRPLLEALEGRSLLSLNPHLLLDINQTGVGSFPTDFTGIGETTFFLDDDGVHGQELWASEGSRPNAHLVKDINPGDASSQIHGIANLNGVLLFFADDGVHGQELWRSDGTNRGTYLVDDINPGPASSGPLPISTVVLDGAMFFNADDGLHGQELWKTDGTADGTHLVSDINTGPAGSDPSALTRYHGGIIFQARAGGDGTQLWASDGTAAGTTLVKILNSGGDADPRSFTAVGQVLYFAADDGTNGRQLWKTDGTADGTGEVTVITGLGTAPGVGDLMGSGCKFFFSADHELWVSDGTAAGTVAISTAIDPTNLTALNGTVVFGATDAAAGSELWVSDGTAAGTARLKDINPGPSGSSPSADVSSQTDYAPFASFDGRVYFAAGDHTHGRQLWESDGTAAGTIMLTDINPAGIGNYGSFNSHPPGANAREVAAVDGRLFFSASDGFHGSQPWTSPGTSDGTRMVKSIGTGTNGSEPAENYVTAGKLTFFEAHDGVHGDELWATDGTAAGTHLVSDIDPGRNGSYPFELTPFDNKILFAADDGVHGRRLWISDGTESGTFQLNDLSISPGPAVAYPIPYFAELKGVMLFAADDGVNGRELWRTDGTVAGTVLLEDIATGTYPGPHQTPRSSFPTDLVAFDGKVYFSASDGVGGTQLWASDGTTNGTSPITDLNPGQFGGIYPAHLTAFHGHLFFSANDGVNGTQLWETDGTAAGTTMITDVNPGQHAGISPANLTVVGNRLFFTARDDTHGNELWVSDGTVAGTGQIKDINPGAGDSIAAQPLIMSEVNGMLLFSADDGTHGVELWRSNGTPGGTTLVKDINPGSAAGLPAYPGYSAVVAGRVFFAADDGTHPGGELWMSDGTPGGTVKVRVNGRDGLSLFTGIGGKTMANANGSLIFTANDGAHGFEPWIIPSAQIRKLGHQEDGARQEGGESREDEEPSGRAIGTRVGTTVLALAPSAGPRPLATMATPTSNIPNVVVGRSKRVVPAILPQGPPGAFGARNPRVVYDRAPALRRAGLVLR